MSFFKWFVIALFGCMLVSGCAVDHSGAVQGADVVEPIPTAQPQSQPSEQEFNPLRVWVEPNMPEEIRASVLAKETVQLEKDKNAASGWFTGLSGTEGIELFCQIYALAAAFPTLEDEFALDDLTAIWHAQKGAPEHILVMDEETRRDFTALWGEAADSQVLLVEKDELISTLWDTKGALAILPFEEIDPRLKVLAVDGLNPLEKGLDEKVYPLRSRYGILLNPDAGQADAAKWNSLFPERPQAINRDEKLLTSVLLTGTTALSRNTAFAMEEKGILFPARDIGEWLQNADITHVSNEVPMFAGCPPAKPLREEARFCSDPAYIDLFEFSGVDVIELTGNHLLDWGAEAFIETLALYDEKGYAYYGGGQTPEAGHRPLLMNDHGNKIALIGCNAVGPQQVWASETQPGPVRCDLEQMETQIRQLKQDGFVVIVTFQHFELDDYRPQSSQRIDFQRMAKAGADIVSGSQAHYPQTMTLMGKSFIHYGLGNLFFDQMFAGYDREFLDEHYIYNGRYISTQLRTAMLEDFARPRPMTSEEREKLLEAVFAAAEWNIEE